MDLKSYYSEKLSNVLFVQIKSETVKNIFDYDLNGSEIYFPISSTEIIESVKHGLKHDNFPASAFIEGMFFVLGIDSKFKYAQSYVEIIRQRNENINFIKGQIYKLVKDSNYEYAYILIKGLLEIEKNEDNYSKAILILYELKDKESFFRDEELSIIDEAKSITGFSLPYLYQSYILKDERKYEDAFNSINLYFSNKGEKLKEIMDYYEELKTTVYFNRAQSMVASDPKNALKILIPMLSKKEECEEVYYNIAVAYRNLELYEKAIYYLNELLAQNGDYIEAFNELGINYACIGNYYSAAKYFKKAFEVSNSIEICTNLIMCYINSNDIKNAEKFCEIAEKINANDEVLCKLKNKIRNVKINIRGEKKQ